MQKKVLVLVIGAALGLSAGSAGAGVNDKMKDMFRSHSNVTRPGVAEGASRGVVTGGSAQIRFPIERPGGFAFDPPSVSSGCGGFDLHGGNLSFPNAQQYIDTARAVIGNIGGFAFQFALANISSQSESIMSKIKDTVQQLNFADKSSCEIAQGIWNGSATAGIKERMDGISEVWSQDSGLTQDRYSASNPGGESASVVAARKSPEMRELVHGNWTWNSMKRTKAVEWLGESREAKEEFLSLVGTVISCAPGVGSCPSTDGKELVIRNLKPSLTLQDFVALDDQRTDQVTVYSCGGDIEECVSASPVQRRLASSVSQYVVDILLGKDGQPGYLQRQTMRGDEVSARTPEETSITSAMQTHTLAADAVQCYKASERGKGAAELIVRTVAPMIAAELLYTMSVEATKEMITDLYARTENTAAIEAGRMLEESNQSLYMQLEEIRKLTYKPGGVEEAIKRCAGSTVARATYLGGR